jgi:hypothetical protein
MGRGPRNLLKSRFEREFFANIPDKPGVYFMRAADGKILYIGKATSLRKRISSYRNAKPGKVGDNIVKLLGKVEKINWELCATEREAWTRELILIRALVPQYNIENAWREDYFFIGLSRVAKGKFTFHLTSDESRILENVELHGCYPVRRWVKYGYSSLLRLIYAISQENGRFSFPAKISRPSPCYRYTVKICRPHYWRRRISAFLHGESSRFLHSLVSALLENGNIPEYVRPGLQRDLKSLQSFERTCIQSRNWRRTKGLEQSFVTHRQLRRRLRESIELEPALELGHP